MNKVKRYVLICVSLLFLIGAFTVYADLTDFSPGLLRHIQSTWGDQAVVRMQGWHTLEQQAESNRSDSKLLLDTDQLQFANSFWNNISYFRDLKHWKAEDYWATPVEMIASNGGDCEDYSIAKYFSLKELGVTPGSLRITYVRALELNESHMVLAYYKTPDADPLILDNLKETIMRASERSDLQPVYSFNDDDLWAEGSPNFKGKSGQIRVWRELLNKMELERRM